MTWYTTGFCHLFAKYLSMYLPSESGMKILIIWFRLYEKQTLQTWIVQIVSNTYITDELFKLILCVVIVVNIIINHLTTLDKTI